MHTLIENNADTDQAISSQSGLSDVVMSHPVAKRGLVMPVTFLLVVCFN